MKSVCRPDAVRQLVDTQFPEFSGLSLKPLAATGSTNVMYRLGEAHLVRLPRQPGAGQAILKEKQWTPVIAPYLSAAVPEVIRIGEPAELFPETWAIVNWLPGELPDACGPNTPGARWRQQLAADLADFIQSLRAIAVTEAATQQSGLRGYRGSPLAAFDRTFRKKR